MHHRHVLLVAVQAEVVNRAGVEIAAIADADQIELGDGVGRQAEKRGEGVLVLRQPIILEEGIIGDQHAFPAPDPFVVERELAAGVDGATELAIAGLARIGPGIQLIDSIGADLVGPIDQPLAEFALEQHALPGGEARADGGVVIGSDGPVERRFNSVSVARHRGESRHEKSRLALDGRVGRREIRQVRHGNAEEFQPGVLEIQHLVGLVVDDARGLDLPQRRLLRIVLARGAGGVDAVLEHRVIAVRAVGARRGHPRRVGGVDPQRIDESIAIVVAQIHDVGVGDLAVRIGDADVAFGMQPLGLLIVDDLVGLDAGSVVEQLDVADRRHPRTVVVVVHLHRLNEHLSVIGGMRRRLGPGGARIVAEALGEGGRRRRKGECAGKDETENGCKDGLAGSQPHPVEARLGAPARRQQSMAGGDNGHYPSSWYSKAKKPVRPPTLTGSHAAAIGCINSALLKSSVTFDST